MSDALTASVIVALRALRDGEPCEPTAVPAWTVIPPNELVSGSTWRLSPAGAAVLDLVETIDRESADAIRRVAESIVADKWSATAAFQQRALKAEKDLARLHEPIFTAVLAEAARAEGLHGPMPALYSSRLLTEYAEDLETQARWDLGEGPASAMAVLCEEVGELVRAETPEQQREEAIQCMAVLYRFVQSLEGK